ncbi:MAG: biotin--[acetyl-CoA-carboxylase] ligase [Armatimonadetes bacterium]|nr:biotin--[acetyl-CoA-carboxylase] ligase [Armatimonadota bacterium]
MSDVSASDKLPVEVVRVSSIDSTSSYLAQLVASGARVGTAVIAGEQTSGRGQLGRPWHSPRGAFFLSIALTGADPRCLVFGLPVVLARTLRSVCNLQAGCRWPNDIVVDGRKIGGVLIESSARQSVWIVGCGVNVNVSEFPEDLRGSATSALIETGHVAPLEGADGFEEAFFAHLNEFICSPDARHLSGVLTLWRSFDTTAGSLVRVRRQETEGVVEAVAVDGMGRLVTKDGEEFEVVVGASTLEWLRAGPAPHI